MPRRVLAVAGRLPDSARLPGASIAAQRHYRDALLDFAGRIALTAVAYRKSFVCETSPEGHQRVLARHPTWRRLLSRPSVSVLNALPQGFRHTGPPPVLVAAAPLAGRLLTCFRAQPGVPALPLPLAVAQALHHGTLSLERVVLG